MSTNPVLIFGATGLVGQELARGFQNTQLLSSKDCDIRDKEQVEKIISQTRPRLVINAAATSNVDEAEKNPDDALKTNAQGAAYIAIACAKNHSPFIHISSDYVFDGTKSSPYVETDSIHPISEYGRSKAEAEDLILRVKEENPDFKLTIVRTSWVFGRGRHNFPEIILKKALQDGSASLKVVDDQTGSPTLALHLSDAIKALYEKKFFGIIHFANSGFCTRFEMATKTLELAQTLLTKRSTSSKIIERLNPMLVKKAKTSDFPRPARRPQFSPLNTNLYTQVTGLKPYPWEQALELHLAQIEEMGFFKEMKVIGS